jgi:hypothetical protein
MGPRPLAGLVAVLVSIPGLSCTPNLDTNEVDDFTELVEALRPVTEAECDWLFSCCTAGERLWSLGPSVISADTCAARLEDAVMTGNVPTELSGTPAALLLPAALELSEGRVTLDDEGLALCLASIRDRPCNVYAPPPMACVPGDPPAVDDPCDPSNIYVGTVPVGGECNPSYGWACAPGTVCESFGSKGVCARRSADGETCSSDGDCGEGLLCTWTTGLCAPGSGPGGACGYVDPDEPVPGTETIRCADGLDCDPVTMRCVPPCFPGARCDDEDDCPAELVCAGSLCRAPGSPGDPCEDHEDCAQAGCDFDLLKCLTPAGLGEFCQSSVECESHWCDYITLTCADPRPAGEPCDANDDDECRDGWCDTGDWTMPVCKAYVNEGEACPDFFCNPDTPELECIEELCVLTPLALGATCVSNSDCESGVCFEDVCQPRAIAGETCDANGSAAPPCEDGLYCDASEFGLLGACAIRGRAGDDCGMERECYGSCQIRWGLQLCDAVDPWDLEETWCDGA